MNFQMIYDYCYCPCCSKYGGIIYNPRTSFIKDIAFKIFDNEKKYNQMVSKKLFDHIFNNLFWKDKDIKVKENRKNSNNHYLVSCKFYDWYCDAPGEFINFNIPFYLNTYIEDYFVAPILLFDKGVKVLTFLKGYNTFKDLSRNLYLRLLSIAIYNTVKYWPTFINFYFTDQLMFIQSELETGEIFANKTEMIIKNIIDGINNKQIYPVMENCLKCIYKKICLMN